jgi:hypothetical protein
MKSISPNYFFFLKLSLFLSRELSLLVSTYLTGEFAGVRV